MTEELLVAKNSMPEEDPNGNTLHDAREIRWGPQHAGAKLLASQYTKGNSVRFVAFVTFSPFVDRKTYPRNNINYPLCYSDDLQFRLYLSLF